MADAERRQAGDRGGNMSSELTVTIFQCRGEGGATAHGPSDGPGGAPLGRSTAETQVPMGKDMLTDKATYSATKAIGVYGFCNAQTGGRQEDVVNGGAGVLDPPIDMAVG